MEYRKAYQDMIKAFPGGWPAMAAALGTSQSSLENRVYERKGMTMTVELARQIQINSGTTRFAEAAAVDAGGTFVRLPEIENIGNDELFKKFLHLNTRLGDLSREYQQSTADGHVDGKEWARLNHIVSDMHQTLQELMAITRKVFCIKEM